MKRYKIGQKVRVNTDKGLRAGVVTHINFYNYTIYVMHMKTRKGTWFNVENVYPYDYISKENEK